MEPKYVENIAFVGAGGRSGRFIVDALAQSGRHRVTAITRPDSTNEMPTTLHDIKKVDYNNHSALVEALKDQDILIITMNVFAFKESQTQLIDAAVEAGVKWVIPNEWGIDLSKPGLAEDTGIGQRILDMRSYIERVGAGKLKWIGICCSFWYEFSLAGSETRYGFDFKTKRLTLFNDGHTKINTSTFAQVARAVVGLLSLKIQSDRDREPSLNQYANRVVYISSFFIDQKQMLDSVLRVTGQNETEWTISYEDSKARYRRGRDLAGEAKAEGYVLMLYSRVFYSDGSGDFVDKLNNNVLGLPEEDLDEATRIAVKMAESGETNMPK